MLRNGTWSYSKRPSTERNIIYLRFKSTIVHVKYEIEYHDIKYIRSRQTSRLFTFEYITHGDFLSLSRLYILGNINNSFINILENISHIPFYIFSLWEFTRIDFWDPMNISRVINI